MRTLLNTSAILPRFDCASHFARWLAHPGVPRQRFTPESVSTSLKIATQQADEEAEAIATAFREGL